MHQHKLPTFSELYTEDETAWLDASVELLLLEQYHRLDFANLREYLTDMAARDRREVSSRLLVLLQHILKWIYQPELRSRSWATTILHQQYELSELAGRGVLQSHACDVLGQKYRQGVQEAALETGLSESIFPVECPLTFEQLLNYKTGELNQSEFQPRTPVQAG